MQRGVLEDVEYLAEDLVWVPKDLFKIFEAEGELNVPGMPIELNFLLTPETLDAGEPLADAEVGVADVGFPLEV